MSVCKFVKTADALLCGRKCFRPILMPSHALNVKASLFSVKSIPQAPKKPLTAYMIFCKENRQSLLNENPHLSVTEQIKILAEKWSNLSQDMKKPYETTAREKTILYGQEHKDYYEQLTDEQRTELLRLKLEKQQQRKLYRLKKTVKESGMPRNPLTSYALFVQSYTLETDGKKPMAFIKEAAKAWKDMSDADKKAFSERAELDKKRYQDEMKTWKESLLKDGNTKILQSYKQLYGKSLVDDTDDSSSQPIHVRTRKLKPALIEKKAAEESKSWKASLLKTYEGIKEKGTKLNVGGKVPKT